MLHLLKELALAGFLAVQIKVQRGLFHAMYFIAAGHFLHGNLGSMQSFLKSRVARVSYGS
jgi:hypothetical protein